MIQHLPLAPPRRAKAIPLTKMMRNFAWRWSCPCQCRKPAKQPRQRHRSVPVLVFEIARSSMSHRGDMVHRNPVHRSCEARAHVCPCVCVCVCVISSESGLSYWSCNHTHTSSPPPPTHPHVIDHHAGRGAAGVCGLRRGAVPWRRCVRAVW